MRIFGPVLRFFGRYARLESRVTDLEKKLEKRSAKDCPSCGGQKYFIKVSVPEYSKNNGVPNTQPHHILEYSHQYECQECAYKIIVRERATPRL